MALTIIKSSQPLLVESIIFYLYTDPGIGKSTLAHTAEKPVVFDFDKGSHRVGNKLRRGDVVPVRQWSDVASMVENDLTEFKTIVCDTVGAMLDCIKTHLSNNSENRQRDGSLTIKAQGLANNMFMQTINKWISYGKDVVFIAHAVEEESGKDKIKVFRPDLGGKNRNMLYRMADVMGYMNSNTNAEGVMERIINFCPSPTHHAKNSGNLNEVLVPDMEFDATFLARLIQQSKDYINSMTPEQIAETKAQEDLNNFKQNCEEAKYASDLKQLTESLDREHRYAMDMWYAIQIQAKTLKCTFNKENKRWSTEEPEEKAVQVDEDVVHQELLVDLLDRVAKAITPAEANAQIKYTKSWTPEQRTPLISAINKRLVELNRPKTQLSLAVRIQRAEDLTELDGLEIDVSACDEEIQPRLMELVEKRRLELDPFTAAIGEP